MSALRSRGKELEKGEMAGKERRGGGKALMETDRTACCVNTHKQRQKGST